MSVLALAGMAMSLGIAAGPAGARTPEGDAELNLLSEATHASFYAVDQFRCRGLAFRAARREADRALGRDFSKRLSAAAEKLKTTFGEERLETATTILPIGYRLTPEYCRKASGRVARARRALSDLESRLGAR